jgi:hypothetical protein
MSQTRKKNKTKKVAVCISGQYIWGKLLFLGFHFLSALQKSLLTEGHGLWNKETSKRQSTSTF